MQAVGTLESSDFPQQANRKGEEMNKELKEKLKKLKWEKKKWRKYQRKLEKIFKNECYWLNWLLEKKLPYLRFQHAAYKRNLRQLVKFPIDMGDTYTFIADCDYMIQQFDLKILDTIAELGEK